MSILVNPALATVFPTQGRAPENHQARRVDCHGRKGAQDQRAGSEGCPCQKARGRMGHGPSKKRFEMEGGAGWPCGVRESSVQDWPD